MTAIKMKQRSMMNLENDLRAGPFKNSNLDMIGYVQSGNHICPTDPSMKHPLN
jgi:hypothetical protein